MKVLVLGATGMLGHRLLWGLDQLGYDVLGGVREDVSKVEPFRRLPILADARRVVTGLDGYDVSSLGERLRALRPEVILNCIGVVKQSDDGQSSVPCITLNALLPHVLEEFASKWGSWLIHFSTDCVFKGDRGGYREEDPSDATDWYGRTKAMGEVQGDNALTLRTSIIGPELRSHRSLLDWFLRQEGSSVKGFTHAIYSGITTREMVNVIDLVLREHPRLHGLYQVASEAISKYQLLCLIRDAAKLDIDIEPDEIGLRIDRSLQAERFFWMTGYQAPPWPQMVAELVDDIKTHQNVLSGSMAQTNVDGG